jgi:hypothetical protein
VPLENAAEAAVVEGVDVYGVCSLSQVVQFLRGDLALEPVRSMNGWPEVGSSEHDLDFEVKGQQHVKRESKSPPLEDIIFSPLDLFRRSYRDLPFIPRRHNKNSWR